MAIQPGSKVGRYQIKAIIGKGGMAVVYKAFDTRLERDVAFKLIRMERFTPEQWPQIRKRFEREAKVMAKLDHPHIIKVFDYGEFEGTPYLVMQLVEGGSLKQRIGKPIPWQDAIQQLKPIAEALEYAHRQGIVHRDVKPGNILYTKEGNALLADFGIAKIVESTGGDSLTSSGVGMGTPEYMAPEQAMGKKIDQRADIYSLGVILYEMITGTRPFKADTPMEVYAKQTRDALPSPRNVVRGLPDFVEEFLHKALAKDPGDRHADMAEFGHDVAALASGKEPAPRRAAAPARQVAPARRDMTVIDKPSEREKKKGVPKWVWGLMGSTCLVLIFIMVLTGNVPIVIRPAAIQATSTESTTLKTVEYPLNETEISVLSPETPANTNLSIKPHNQRPISLEGLNSYQPITIDNYKELKSLNISHKLRLWPKDLIKYNLSNSSDQEYINFHYAHSNTIFFSYKIKSWDKKTPPAYDLSLDTRALAVLYRVEKRIEVVSTERNGEIIWEHVLTDEVPLGFAISSDASKIAVHLTTNDIHLFNIVTGTDFIIDSPSTNSSDIRYTNLVFTPDGKFLVFQDSVSNISIWDMTTMSEYDSIRTNYYSDWNSRLLSRSSKYMIFKFKENILRVYDFKEKNIVAEFAMPYKYVTAFDTNSNVVHYEYDFSNDERMFIFIDGFGNLSIWDLDKKEYLLEKKSISKDVTDFEISADDRLIFINGGYNYEIKVFDIDLLKMVDRIDLGKVFPKFFRLIDGRILCIFTNWDYDSVIWGIHNK